jgi:hypothetical protein
MKRSVYASKTMKCVRFYVLMRPKKEGGGVKEDPILIDRETTP